ncbi:hypothetical protein DRW07_11385 [Alteromonas sediminis]|uniref:Uncharacterized protein n=1 Tax=Alteromonas sediminis TaxID=2259342 RepID=A0A3N5Z7J9_9ALTE|nr:hypothetical protein [Alteromonas sediminis]RPJ66674.1 hypothetical protein DRW07_11385 [Alteromonas sediminis]
MKTSLTLMGFILLFTGAMLFIAGIVTVFLEPEQFAILIIMCAGVIALKFGEFILNKCATYRWRGQRRPHITHRLAR